MLEELSNVSILKSTIRRFPGIIIGGLHRQIGKTTAILELIHEDHRGQAWYFCQNEQARRHAILLYRQMYGFETFYSATMVEMLGGSLDWPVYVDEWESIPTITREKLICNRIRNPIFCRIGSSL